MNRICQIDIDDSALPAPSPEMVQERNVAIFDLLEDNSFAIPARNGAPAPVGPFVLGLGVREGRLVFDTATQGGEKVAAVMTEPVCAEVIIVPVSCVTMESTCPESAESTRSLRFFLSMCQEECVMSIRIISASNAVP